MKNMKIEAIVKEQMEILEKFGRESDEFSTWYKKHTDGARKVISAYVGSKDLGFDEIVFNSDDLIWEKEVPEVIEFCQEAKIGWFVYGSGYSRAMEVIMALTEAGAKVGKFVVKEYTDTRWGEENVVKVPGIRINL